MWQGCALYGVFSNDNIAETFSFYAFPDRHWIKLKTNNPLERLMREIRRRTRVVGAAGLSTGPAPHSAQLR